MMAYINDTATDVTPYTAKYQRSDNINALGQEFSFDYSANPLEGKQGLDIGTKIIVSNNNNTIFAGIIISYNRNSLANYQYKAYDYCYYLNKSESVIQFNDITIKKALIQLCEQESITYNIPIEIPTKISKIYNGEPISNIINDLLKLATDETGAKYRREFNNGKLYIDSYTNLVLEATYKPANNKAAFNPVDVIGSFNASYSAESLCNRIVIISSSEKNRQVHAENKDESSIKRFGQLTHYEKLDDKNISQAKEIAKKKLKELNKIKRSFSLTLLGDDNIRSGRMIKFNQDSINLVGTYLITNCKHNYNGCIHTMDLELKMEGE